MERTYAPILADGSYGLAPGGRMGTGSWLLCILLRLRLALVSVAMEPLPVLLCPLCFCQGDREEKWVSRAFGRVTSTGSHPNGLAISEAKGVPMSSSSKPIKYASITIVLTPSDQARVKCVSYGCQH